MTMEMWWLNLNKKCKYCNKDLPENEKGRVCKSCRDKRVGRAEKVGAGIGALVLTVGSVVLKIVLKK